MVGKRRFQPRRRAGHRLYGGIVSDTFEACLAAFMNWSAPLPRFMP